MDLRTTIEIEPSELRINHNSPVAFIGSCFAAEIAGKIADGKMSVLVNPFGTVYNPVSISDTLSVIIENRRFDIKDLIKYKDRYISLLHYTGFSSDDPGKLLENINSTVSASHDFLARAEIIFVTFGTARVYRYNETGMIVSNCHKIDSKLFSQELLSADDIVFLWNNQLDNLRAFNKNARVIFTISPVRHLKDGAHGNQVSKAVLFLAVEKLLSHPSAGGYFPAYEILMDDLRDYRYYAEDMLHPSLTAIEYIWNAFSGCYLTSDALSVWKEARRIAKALNHRFLTDSVPARRDFANEMLRKIFALARRAPWIDLDNERSYFEKIISTPE